MRRLTVSVAYLFVLVSASAVEASPPGGFLMNVEVASGECRLSSVASVEHFSPKNRGFLPDDWRIELRTAEGDVLWEDRVRNPWDVSPVPAGGQRLQLSLRVPRLSNSAEAVLSDQTGREVLAVAIDDGFVEAAHDARKRFIEHDARNRARLRRWKTRSGEKQTGLSLVAPIPRYEDLESDIRRHFDSRTALDVNRLQRFGVSPRQAARGNGVLAAISAIHRDRERPHDGGIDARGKSLLQDVDYTLSGTVWDAETSQPVADVDLYFYQYDFDWNYQRYLGWTRTSEDGHYSKSAEPGNVYVVLESPSYPLYAERYSYTVVRSDTTLDVSMFPGVRLSGSITDDVDGGWIDGVTVRAENPRFSARSPGTVAGDYQLIVPRNQEFTVWAEPDPPYAEPYPADLTLSRDGRWDFKLERGLVLSGRVADPYGSPIADATVIVRHLASSAALGWSTGTGSDGSYSCAIPRDLRPSSFVMSVHSDGFVRYSGSVSPVSDTTVDVTLVPGFRVEGLVSDESGAPLEEAIVRVFQEERFLTSATTESDGSYGLGLEPGTYTFRVTPPTAEVPTPLAPAESVGVSVEGDTALDFTLPPSEAVVTVRLDYPSEEAAEISQGILRLEVRRDGAPLFVTFDSDSGVFFDPVGETFFRETRLYLEPGLYDVVLYPIGGDPITLSNVVASAKTTVRQTLTEPYRWSGVLRTADGDALAGLAVISYDDLAVQYTVHSTDRDGHFSVPLTPGGTLRFFSPEAGASIRRIERIAEDVSSRFEDCYLDSFPDVVDNGGVLTQIWGSGSPEDRYNLVIIGDGYTDITETYTDLNDNGMWDAVLYYDLNGNGVLDRGSGERYSIYGAAQTPQDGTDPTVDNEPFVDLNGDGFPNLDDQATYDSNSEAIVRALFGSDVWTQFRDAFNVYRIRVVSEQAGHDVLDGDYQPLIERDTALNTYIYDPDRSYILAVDNGIVDQYVDQYTAFADTVIVLMNQPVRIGRATSYIMARGGLTELAANRYTMSHEMGHNVGLVADEYTEFPETYEGPELLRPNITTFSDRDRIPWADLIEGDKGIPSLANTPGVGLFEGAYYQPAGIYRPVQMCTMNGSERFCPVCTREISHVVTGLGGEIPGTTDLIAPVGRTSSYTPRFEWTGPTGASHYRLELTAVDDPNESYSFDVYASHFDPVFVLRPNTTYRWRVVPGSGHHWGSSSQFVTFTTPLPQPRAGGRRVSP